MYIGSVNIYLKYKYMDKNKILFLAFALYCISMALPGVSSVGYSGSHSVYGIFILAFGWIAMVKWVFAWFANPLFLFAVFRSRVEKSGMILIVSIIAFCFGLDAYLLREVPNIAPEIPVDHLAIGYYVWMASLGLLVLYGFQRYYSQEKEPERILQVEKTDSSLILRKYARRLIGGIVLLLMSLIYKLLVK